MAGVSNFQIIMLLNGSALCIMWVILYFKYHTAYDELIKPLNRNDFFMYEIFLIGFGIMKLIGYNMKNSRSKRKIKKISEAKGENYAEYYYFIITGGKITYFITFLPIAFLLGALFDDIFIFVLALLTAIILIVYLDYEIESAVNKRRDELLSDLPYVLSKLALLLNVGMTLRAAWANISASGQSYLYREMQATVEDINNGISEAEAYRDFAERCVVKEVRKFSSILIQSLQKGSSEITALIKKMADDSWQQKKYKVKVKGELASSKLMLPVGLMLVSIMIMIIIPILSSI